MPIHIETLKSECLQADVSFAVILPDLKLRITVGQNDNPRIVRENRELHALLSENNQTHFYEETPGGHEYAPYGWEGIAWAAKQLQAAEREVRGQTA